MQPLKGKDFIKVAVIVGIIVIPVIVGLVIWKYQKFLLQN
jgi:hypothetical protein